MEQETAEKIKKTILMNIAVMMIAVVSFTISYVFNYVILRAYLNILVLAGFALVNYSIWKDDILKKVEITKL